MLSDQGDDRVTPDNNREIRAFSKSGRARFQFNLGNLFLITGGVALLAGARIHTQEYFGRVVMLAALFVLAAFFVTKILRIPNDGRMRRDFIGDEDSDQATDS